MSKILRDDDVMPNGIHKGKKMADVPADYLLWLLDNNKCSNDVREYIVDIKDALLCEVKLKNYNKRI